MGGGIHVDSAAPAELTRLLIHPETGAGLLSRRPQTNLAERSWVTCN